METNNEAVNGYLAKILLANTKMDVYNLLMESCLNTRVSCKEHEHYVLRAANERLAELPNPTNTVKQGL